MINLLRDDFFYILCGKTFAAPGHNGGSYIGVIFRYCGRLGCLGYPNKKEFIIFLIIQVPFQDHSFPVF
ncbi:MAG: hypothetical protein R3214_03340 [Christiangramia sp.]|nr:hypothetical protein [Christiangramia sp.]